MLKLIKMNKEKVNSIIIATLAVGLFISYFFTGFLALPFIAGLFIGERFINPILFPTQDEK
tara:strand:- start:1059 stop:1241 length:183 start_codon:yes stop_codon:yes gene_type:complete